ncbi:hypothetical protein DN310_10475 [Salmonella enterica subsp. salamae]|uniref:Uncharacterized protein n=1 Tax=Salmonella enterica subsp. salamae TaxID=59202 RepID=A0A5Y3MR00_SALER|nr:hypothetical protein [Salmonella enterica subsp. salamae]
MTIHKERERNVSLLIENDRYHKIDICSFVIDIKLCFISSPIFIKVLMLSCQLQTATLTDSKGEWGVWQLAPLAPR